jgi:hypothetical protein
MDGLSESLPKAVYAIPSPFPGARYTAGSQRHPHRTGVLPLEKVRQSGIGIIHTEEGFNLTTQRVVTLPAAADAKAARSDTGRSTPA